MRGSSRRSSLWRDFLIANGLVSISVAAAKQCTHIQTGKACFVAASRPGLPDATNKACRFCGFPFESYNGQQILAHNASHILYDKANIDPASEPCGLCLCAHTVCRIYLKRTKATPGGLTVDPQRSKCLNPVKFRYKKARESTSKSPCSNVPMRCELCPADAPAVWRYNYSHHLRRAHSTVPREAYESAVKLSEFERTELKRIWDTRKKVPKPRAKARPAPLVISEAHSSSQALRCAERCFQLV
ncbi:hypothetical protein EV122DRAFT_224846 [Schizophyllum commune]